MVLFWFLRLDLATTGLLCALIIVMERQYPVAGLFGQQLATYSIILRRHAVNGFLCAHTVRAVVVREGFAVLRHGGQFTSVLWPQPVQHMLHRLCLPKERILTTI